MQDLLQRLDLDYYRSALLLMVRAEIEQFRRQSSAPARAEPQCIPAGASQPPADDLNQKLPAGGPLC